MKSRGTATVAMLVGFGLVCSTIAEAQAPGDASPEAAAPNTSPGGTSEAAAPPPETPAPEAGGAPVAPQATETPEAPPVAGGIETVVVTARRTAENLQVVPVAISAFSAKDLEREQITTGQDLQGRIPSLTISPNSTTRNAEVPTIRGQGASFGSSPGVVIYYAEVPVPTDSLFQGQGGPGKFFDLANLQVLKGSQGTLFGRNTTGGALLLEPHKPDPTFSASITDDETNYSGRTISAIVNMPIVEDKLLLRLGVQDVERKGFTKDVTTGKDYDSRGYWTTRLGLTWKPTDRIENYLLGYYTHSEDNGTGVVIDEFNQAGLNYGILAQIRLLLGLPPPTQALADQLNAGCLYFNLLGPTNNCGQDIVAAQQARDVRHVQLSADPFDMIETGSAIDQFKFELNDQLSLRNIASYSFYKHNFRLDFDGSIAAFNETVNSNDVQAADSAQYSEELQLQGSALDDRLKYVVGGYYQNQKPQGDQVQNNVALLIPIPTEKYGITQESYAPYAQGTYDLGGLIESLDGLKFTLGVRYTTDHVDGFGNAGGEHSAQLDKSAVTWTTGLDYKLPSTLLYGKVSRGYKAGGFAPTAVNPVDYTFKPEYVTNYEIGQKSDFELGEIPARVNAALYYTSYTDMQRAASDAYFNLAKNVHQFGEAVFNAGKASIYGFEMDATVQPFTGLSLMANYAFTYGKYDKFNLQNNGINPQLDCTGQLIASGSFVQLQCVPFQYTPRHQTSVTAHYDLPVDPTFGRVNGSVTYSWTDKQYSSSYTLPQAEPGAWIGAFGLLNASLQWSAIQGSAFDLQFYGTNLADRTYRVSNSNQWNLVYFRSSMYGEPRIFGLQLAYHWGN